MSDWNREQYVLSWRRSEGVETQDGVPIEREVDYNIVTLIIYVSKQNDSWSCCGASKHVKSVVRNLGLDLQRQVSAATTHQYKGENIDCSY